MPVHFSAIQPQTFEEAVTHIVTGLTDEERTVIREDGMVQFHHGPGREMRNAWSLWYENQLTRDIQTRFGVENLGDDISGFIFREVEKQIRSTENG